MEMKLVNQKVNMFINKIRELNMYKNFIKIKLKILLIILNLFFFNVLNAKESSVVGDSDNIYKNVLDLNPTSEGFYIGYERVLFFSKGAIFIFDVKNTSENGDDFGRTGFTFRYGMTPKSVLSTRLETAWIDGHNNIAFKIGYDAPLMGLSLTGVQSLSDSEVLRSEDTVLSSSSVSTDTRTGSSGAYDNYRKDTTTTNQVSVKETKYATPDGILIDLNFNVFKQFNLTLGGSHWKKDNWSETGYHGNFSWNITKGDTIGGHIANIDGNTEGGLYYRKKFNSLGDIFHKGESFDPSEEPSLFNKVASTPFSTPPIRIMTSSEFIETHEEVKVEKTTETYKKRKPESVDTNPTITTYDIASTGFSAGEVGYDINGTDSNGNIVFWKLVSSASGLISSGANLPYADTFNNGATGMTTFTLTIRDNDGNETSEAKTINVI